MIEDQGPRYSPLVVLDESGFGVARWSATAGEWRTGQLDALAHEWRSWQRALLRAGLHGERRSRALAVLDALRAVSARLACRTTGLAAIARRAQVPRVTWPPPGQLAALTSPANGPPVLIRAGPPFATRR